MELAPERVSKREGDRETETDIQTGRQTESER